MNRCAQIGRLRDSVDDRKLSRKRLRRLIEKEVALPFMLAEAHRIIASSLLRSGYDTDLEKCMEVRRHMEAWLDLTPVEQRAPVLFTCCQWLRDRLHLDAFRMHLLEVRGAGLHGCPAVRSRSRVWRRHRAPMRALVLCNGRTRALCVCVQMWAELELEWDRKRLAEGVAQPPNPEVFLELAFHSVRQEAYDDGIKWVSLLTELCPNVLEHVDVLLNRAGIKVAVTTAGAGGASKEEMAALDALFGVPDAGSRGKDARRRVPGDRSFAMTEEQRGTVEERRAAVLRAIRLAKEGTPGPGAYDHHSGALRDHVLSPGVCVRSFPCVCACAFVRAWFRAFTVLVASAALVAAGMARQVLSQFKTAPIVSIAVPLPSPPPPVLPGPADYETRIGVCVCLVCPCTEPQRRLCVLML